MFFVIWQGWGILSILIPVLCILPFVGLPNGLVLGVGLLVGAAVNAYVGHRLNNQPGKTYIDKDTGGEVIFRKKHTLFFVPMQYLSVLWVVMGVFSFQRLTRRVMLRLERTQTHRQLMRMILMLPGFLSHPIEALAQTVALSQQQLALLGVQSEEHT